MFKEETIQLPLGNAQLNKESSNGATSTATNWKTAWIDNWNAKMRQDHAPAEWLSEQSTLNGGMLERLYELDSTGGLTRKLIMMYFDFSSHTLGQLSQLIENAAPAATQDLARHLHSLKSSSANLGLDRVAGILQRLEHMSLADEKFIAMVRLLAAEIDKGNHALNEWLAAH